MSEYYGEWDTIRGLEVQLAYLTAERDKLRHILEALAGESWEGMDIEVEFFQGLLLREGVFVEVPASDEIREEYGVDTMYQFVWRVEEGAV